MIHFNPEGLRTEGLCQRARITA